MSTLQVKIYISTETNFIICKGDLIGADALEFKSNLKQLTSENKNLSIDLMGINEISLTGLNSILMAKAWSNRNDKHVRLIVSKNSKILNYLEMTKMTSEFIIEFGTAKSIAA